MAICLPSPLPSSVLPVRRLFSPSGPIRRRVDAVRRLNGEYVVHILLAALQVIRLVVVRTVIVVVVLVIALGPTADPRADTRQGVALTHQGAPLPFCSTHVPCISSFLVVVVIINNTYIQYIIIQDMASTYHKLIWSSCVVSIMVPHWSLGVTTTLLTPHSTLHGYTSPIFDMRVATFPLFRCVWVWFSV